MEPSFECEIKKFIDYVSSIRETYPLLQQSISDSAKKAEEKLTSFLEKNDSSSNPEYFIELNKLKSQLKNVKLSSSFLPSTLLVSLVSQYDAYLGKIIRVIFYKKPEKLKGSQKEIVYEDLEEFDSLDEVKNFIVEKEIESVLRDNHKKQIEWLEKKLGIPLRKGLEIWSEFIELTERRNLFVHADGIVSRQYIKNCQENGYKIEENCKVGRRLNVTENYFINAFNCIFEISVKLGHVIWRKIDSDDSANADKNLNELCQFLIAKEDYCLASVLLDFALNTSPINKNFSDEMHLAFLINKAQTLKWSAQEDECRKLLESKDWSTLGLKYKLAKAVLYEDYEESSNLMKLIHKSGEVNKNDYRTLPIYKNFRKTNHFISTFIEIFGESTECQDIVEDSEILEYDNRQLDQLLFDIKDNFISLIRKICVGNDKFPPLEINDTIHEKKLYIHVIFAPSKTHNLDKTLTVIFSIEISNIDDKYLQLKYVYHLSNKPIYDRPDNIPLLFEGNFDEGFIWNELDKILHMIIEKAIK